MATRRVLAALLLPSSLHASLVLAQSQYASPARPTVPVPDTSSQWLTTHKPGASLGTMNTLSTSNLPYSFTDARVAHALLGATAFLFIFPFGGIIIKGWPHRHIVWIHAAIQMLGLAVYVSCVTLGILMGSRLHTLNRYHAILGYFILTFLVIQPLLKMHWLHSAIPRVAFFMHIHLWLGRIALTLGIIDGGLGFRVSMTLWGPHWSEGWRIAYGIIGGIVWIIYVGVCIVWVEVKKVPRVAPLSPGALPPEFLVMASQVAGSESEERLNTGKTVVVASTVEEDVESGTELPIMPRQPARALWNWTVACGNATGAGVLRPASNRELSAMDSTSRDWI